MTSAPQVASPLGQRWTLRWQSLRVVIGLTVILGIVVASTLAYFEQTSRVREQHVAQVRLELERLTDLTALALREPLWQFSPEGADSIVEAAFVNPDIVSIVVQDDRGGSFSRRERPSADPRLFEELTRDITRGGATVGRLTIRMSTAGYVRTIEATRAQYLRSGLVVSGGALLLILLLMHWRLVRPLEELVMASKRIESGKLDIPIRQVFADEVGELACSLEATRLALLSLVAELEARNVALTRANETLEQRVAERTDSLKSALANLEMAQREIVETEKLASLGRVVAGVAHELNTPIGNALTVVSTAQHDLLGLKDQLSKGALRKSSLDDYVARADQGLELATSNIQRAASLIADFKQVAVDQTSDQRRAFDLSEVSREVLNMLQANLRRARCELETHFAPDVACEGYPGRYSQVLTNIVMNAIKHAFEPSTAGQIVVRTEALSETMACVTITDNGVGMDEPVRSRIFDPFFTTKMGRGGTGLGMNIVHSIVTRILGGYVSVTSKPGQGTEIRVEFRRVAPEQS